MIEQLISVFAQLTLDVLFQGKRQIHVLRALYQGPVRIGQLGRLIPGTSKKMLAQSLRKLEAGGIVVRRDFSDLVLHVEYELRPEMRESIGALLDSLADWGIDFLALQESKEWSRKAKNE